MTANGGGNRAAGSEMRVNRIVAVVGALALAAILVTAILVIAWIKGGAQPMRWIEQPVSAGALQQ